MQTPCLSHSTISNNDTYHLFLAWGTRAGEWRRSIHFIACITEELEREKVDVSVGVESTLNEV